MQQKTQLVVTGYIFFHSRLLLVHHTKLKMWLPVGGHIEENETPDEALLREVREEVGLSVEFLQRLSIPLCGSTHTLCATPFHVSVHTVGDHDHCSLFYLCRALNDHVVLNTEVASARWVTEDELCSVEIPQDVQAIGKEAFKLYRSLAASPSL